MKKIKLFSTLLLSTIFLVSCDKENATGESTLEVAEGVVGTIQFNGTLAASQVVNEEDEGVYQYTITLNKPQSVDIHVHVVQSGGTADSDDYEIGDITIPAYSNSAVGTIKIVKDCTLESIETLDIQIGTIATSNATIPNKTVSFTINPYVSDDFDLAFNFNANYSITGVSNSLCNLGYDVDFLILDSSLNDTGIVDAQTGACIENITLTPALLADGTYYIYYFIYDNGGLSTTFHDPFHIPFSIDYGRCGGIDEGTYTLPDSATPLSTAAENTFDYLVTIVVNNNVYTLKNQANEVIVSGRMSNAKKQALITKLINRRK